MTDDAELLRRYARTGAEDAFAELVRRHLNLTWAVAFRVTGDAELARDVAQTVFADLARKAARLPAGTVVAGWLHRAACLAARNVLRGNRRRAAREQEAMNDTEPPSSQVNDPPDPAILLARLDEALATLGETERNAVVLRHLAGKSLAEVGTDLGLTEEAARKRIARAVDKLRDWYGRRATSASTGGVVAALGIAGAQIAPAGLASTITAASLTGVTTLGILETLALMKTKLALGTLAVAAVAAPLTYQQASLHRLQQENATLQASLAARPPSQSESAAPATPPTGAEADRQRAEHLELLRLRGEVGQLRERAANAEAIAAELTRVIERNQGLAAGSGRSADAADDGPGAEEKRLGIAKLNTLKNWGLALHLYASENNEQWPATLADARRFLPSGEDAGDPVDPALSENDLELLVKGRLTDAADPARTIVIRERTPWMSATRGRLCRTYVFADGHSEIYSPPDGDFSRWEQERGLSAP